MDQDEPRHIAIILDGNRRGMPHLKLPAMADQLFRVVLCPKDLARV